MKIGKKVEKAAKQGAEKVLNQALEGLKLLENAAKTYVKLPKGSNEKIQSQLKKLGMASQADLETLETRVAQLEAKLKECCTKETPTDTASLS